MGAGIYLDHNATTPLDPEVVAAMEPYFLELFGNPSSVEHEHGHVAAHAVEAARDDVAAAIGARSQDIVFTGGCTEANNLAIFGAARAQAAKRHIITTVVEHPSVLEPVRALEREGWAATYVGVDSTGRVSVDAIEQSLRPDTALVSVMAANNEVGTLQPLSEIGALCAERDVLFHSDLAQLCAYMDVDVVRSGIHLASLSAHKAYGPKGVGALYVRSRRPRVKVAPILLGGGQERGIRPGTLNSAAIVGFGKAMEIAKARRLQDAIRLRALCQLAVAELSAKVEGIEVNGDPDNRLPNNLSVSIADVEPLALIRRLRGRVSLSASSACATDKVHTSHVLQAMFGDTPRARRAFRIAPGRFTTDRDMELALAVIAAEANQLRESARTAA